ncbi:DUF998 domain-containing protein [Clostridium sp.]|jgi:hypothetical protein|uniref:DUF998 domain-containing protein n=1 Tax=Clostridium sp. TaxID=1506 RepID=UPI002588DFBE|nr:DUF998 domain-containing protein [Clostridium sp.]MDF2504294.1 hypothetical protein [Clostridium sp.]
MKKFYSIFGIVASIAYILYVIIGSLLSGGGYSHLINAISELPYFVPKNQYVYLDKLSTIYAIALILFSIGAFIDFKNYKSRLCRIAFLLLIFNSVSGILMAFFKMDARDSQATFQGMMHLVLSGFCAIFSILSPLLAGLGFKRISKFKHLTIYSLILSLIIFISGGITAAGAANEFRYFGIIERITIGTYIMWILVISFQIFLINLRASVDGRVDKKLNFS